MTFRAQSLKTFALSLKMAQRINFIIANKLARVEWDVGFDVQACQQRRNSDQTVYQPTGRFGNPTN